MRKFSVTVNGTTYEVEIEEVTAVRLFLPLLPLPKRHPPLLRRLLHPRLRLLPEPRR